jgi:hypothetical protein
MIIKEIVMEQNQTKEIKSYLDWSNQGKASIWRYLIGTVVLIMVFFVISGFGILPLAILAPDYKQSLILNVVGILLGFVISFFATPLIVKLMHSRPSWSVAMPVWQFKAWDFWTAIWVGAAVAVVFGMLFSLFGILPIRVNPDFNLMTLLPLTMIAFAGIFIQAGSEEMLFRGYFAQFTRRFTSNKIWIIGIPALLFGLPHIANISKTISGGIFVALPYIISGVLYGWAAYRSGSLWMSLGLHLINNYSSVVMVGTKGDVLPSAAPFIVVPPNNLALITVVIAVQALAVYLAMNFLIKRRERKALEVQQPNA